MKLALVNIERELEERLAELREQGKLLEAQRLEQRTRYDMEMMRRWAFVRALRTIPDRLRSVNAGARRIR